MQGIQNSACIVRQLDKVSTLDRLHDDDRLVELPADLIALAALDRGIVIVNIIELDLHDFDRGILCQDLLEQLGAAMKRNADVADLALFLQSKRRLISAAGLEMAIVLQALRMHEVEIKIIDAAGLELALEHRADVRLGLEKVLRQLVRQDVAVAQITARQAGLERLFALALQIAVRRVKIVEACVQKCVYHAVRLRDIDLAVLHRKAHKAKTEVLFDPFHVRFSFRVIFFILDRRGPAVTSFFDPFPLIKG